MAALQNSARGPLATESLLYAEANARVGLQQGFVVRHSCIIHLLEWIFMLACTACVISPESIDLRSLSAVQAVLWQREHCNSI